MGFLIGKLEGASSTARGADDQMGTWKEIAVLVVLSGIQGATDQGVELNGGLGESGEHP